MKKISQRLQRFTKEDLVRAAAVYAVIVFLLVFLVFPLATLFVKAFQDKDGVFVGLAHFAEYFTSRSMVYSISNTFVISIWSTVISVTLAFFYAYALSRKNVPAKSFFRYVGMVPIFAPTMLLGIALIYLFGNQGILTSLGLEIPLYGKVGIIISESIYCFPAATTILMVAFSAADNRLYEAAETMGTSALRKMVTITIPNVKYGLINAIFVSFTYSFTDFGAPSVVGGNYNVLATDVYKQVVGQQMFFAVALFASLIKLRPYNLTFTLDNYNLSEAGSGSGLTAFKNSILISLISAFLGTLITFIGAYIIEKTQQKFRISRKIAYFLSITPLAIPGTVVGLSFIMFFNASAFNIPFTQYAVLNPLHGIYGTIWIIVFANLIHFYSVPFSTATTALKRLDKEFETVSESLSVPFYRTFAKVTVPLCFPAICEMWVYFFVNSLVTVSAVVFLYSPTAPITSVMIVSMQGAGQTAPAAAMCMLLLFINLIVRLLYEALSHALKKREKKLKV